MCLYACARLKSVAREVQLMQELVAHYALAHPQVTLHMQHEGRRLLFAPASADLRQRLAVIFGQELAAQMLPVPGRVWIWSSRGP